VKILSCVLENFASYERLEFDFSPQGLTLIEGPTGSGKSTLCDAIPWILFGRTAKDGAVDEVRSWTSDEPTKGTITLDINGKMFQVGRKRGAAKDNDLIIWQDGGAYRGKDLNDTQRLINQTLGFNCDLYLAGAYYHEFSQTAQFFQTTAKNRRLICEQLVDLSLAKTLLVKSKENNKAYSTTLREVTDKVSIASAEVETFKRLVSREKDKIAEWKARNYAELLEVKDKYSGFEQAKRSTIQTLKLKAADFTKQKNEQIRELNSEITACRVNILDDTYFELEESNIRNEREAIGDPAPCPECGAPQTKEHADLERRIARINAERQLSEKCRIGVQKLERQVQAIGAQENPYFSQIAHETTRENTYGAQLEALSSAINPHLTTLREHRNALDTAQVELKRHNEEASELENKLADLETLGDVLSLYRSVSMTHTIQAVQDKTNQLLSDYFDAEIRVTFTADDAAVDVEITKDGNVAAYTQLSKGQRQLLKLSFGVAVMKTIAERHAVRFDQLFFDEALDGMDDNFKAKAFRLLESLSLDHDSVFVVEHSEGIKSLFANRFSVELVNGVSQIAKT